MATTVTPGDIAAELGRTAPSPADLLYAQWQRWIDRAEATVARRARRCGTTLEALDQKDLDEVVTYIVVRRHTRPPDNAISVTEQASVDDGSVQESRRYASALGDMHVLDEWWDILGLRKTRGAFTIRSRWSPGYRPC